MFVSRPFIAMNFYPRPPRGGRHARARVRVRTYAISIHALREEGDFRIAALLPRMCKFLSTPSARRATGWPYLRPAGAIYFYPRPPRGGRLEKRCTPEVTGPISIHALREEGDQTFNEFPVKKLIFLSTPSARRATS